MADMRPRRQAPGPVEGLRIGHLADEQGEAGHEQDEARQIGTEQVRGAKHSGAQPPHGQAEQDMDQPISGEDQGAPGLGRDDGGRQHDRQQERGGERHHARPGDRSKRRI